MILLTIIFVIIMFQCLILFLNQKTIKNSKYKQNETTVADLVTINFQYKS